MGPVGNSSDYICDELKPFSEFYKDVHNNTNSKCLLTPSHKIFFAGYRYLQNYFHRG